MQKHPLHQVVQELGRLAGSRSTDEDAALLAAFARERDPAALGVLMERYGPMVLGVCRRRLDDPHLAEDAYQAVFVILMRKAGTLRRPHLLGNWLYGVALRVARRLATRRQHRSLDREVMRSTPAMPADHASDDRELQNLLDEEIGQLASHYRQPLVLCCLEGKTYEEAAQRLGCAVGTVKSRVARARDLLRGRLARRGLTVSSAALAALLTPATLSAAVPPLLQQTLWRAAQQAAAGLPLIEAISPTGLSVAEGVIETMHTSRWSLAAIALVLLGLAGTVAGAMLIPAERHVPPEEQQWFVPTPVVPTVDAHGNPLPEGAVARLGTVQLRHGGTVTAVAFAPDGKSFASVGHDRYLRCWDAVSGKELWRQREAGAPTSLSYSPDGKSLIVGNWGGRMKRTGSSLHARNAADGKSRYLIEKRGGAVSFAADGKHFLSWTSASNLYLWETQTGKAVKTIADNNAAIPFQDEAGDSAVAVLFPDGKTIASFGYGAALQLWDVATGKSIRTLKERPDGIASYALTVSPDGKLLASATNKAPVGLFELPGGKELARFDAEDVYDLFFTPDSKTLAIATLDDEAALWDVATRKKTRTLTGAGPVASLSQDGKSLVCASGLGSWLSVIDWSTGKEKLGTPLSGHSYGLGGVAFTPDARKVFTRSYNSILCWDAGSGKLMERWPSSCGSNAFAGYAGLISSPRGMEIMDGHVGPGEDERVLALSADGTLLASFGGKKGSPEITLWNTATGKPARQLTCEGVRGLAFTPDGKSLAASCDQKADGSICIFDTSTGKLKFELTEKELLSLKPIALSPDGKLAAGGCIGGKVAVWNLLTQGRVHLLDAGEAEVQALAFSNGLLAAGTEKNGVVVWHCDTGKVHVTLEAPGEVHCLAVAPRGNVLAAGGTDGVVRLWDLGTGKLRKELRGHANEITGLAFSADGQKIASTSEDGTALIWELERR